MQPIKLTTILPAALNQIRPSSTFLSVRNYRNNYDELSNFGIVFHARYDKAVQRAIVTWRNYQPKNNFEKDAKLSLLTSYSDSLTGFNYRAKSAHAYRPITDGHELIKSVKWHDNGKAIHIWGFEIHKVVLVPGKYPLDTRDNLTKARNYLLSKTSLGRFRQFKLVEGKFDNITTEGLTLTHRDLLKELT